jgi:hypothetical protein
LSSSRNCRASLTHRLTTTVCLRITLASSRHLQSPWPCNGFATTGPFSSNAD